MSSYDCFRCHSNQTNTFQSAYEHGTRVGTHRGGGHYMSQSALAQQSAPPASPQMSCGALLWIVLISGVISMVFAIGVTRTLVYIGHTAVADAGTTMLSLFMMAIVISFLGGLYLQSRIIKRQMGGYREKLQRWDQSMICRRCSYTWRR